MRIIMQVRSASKLNVMGMVFLLCVRRRDIQASFDDDKCVKGIFLDNFAAHNFSWYAFEINYKGRERRQMRRFTLIFGMRCLETKCILPGAYLKQ